MELFRASRKGAILSPEDVAWAASALSESQPALSSGLNLFDAALQELPLKKCLQDANVWQRSLQHPLLRLVLLHQLSLKGGVKAWAALRVSDVTVLDTVAQVSVYLNSLAAGHASSSKLSSVDYDLKASARSLLDMLGEDKMPALVHQSIGSLSADRALALHQHFGEALPAAVLTPLLDAALEDSAGVMLIEEDMLSLAMAMEHNGLADEYQWEKLATLLTRHWSRSDSRTLLKAMLVLPEFLQVAPGRLKRALIPLCHTTVLASLPHGCFCWLLDAWGTWSNNNTVQHLPPVLSLLIRPAVERHLQDLDVKRLITASRILDACEGGEAVVDILLFWQSWAEDLVSDCKVKTWRWSIFQEALREVAGSKHLHGKTGQTATLGDMIMEGILLQELVTAKDGLPLDLLLDVGRRLPQDRRSELSGALHDLLWHCLAGRGGGLSLLNAVVIAQGEACVACEPGSQLHDALIAHIVKMLTTSSAVTLFCRCRPCPSVLEPVLKKVKGWQRLELNVMLR